MGKDKDFELQTGWVFYTKYRKDKNGNVDRESYARVCYRNTFYNVEDPEAFFREGALAFFAGVSSGTAVSDFSCFASAN